MSDLREGTLTGEDFSPTEQLATERLAEEIAALDPSAHAAPPPRAASLTIYSRAATLQLSIEPGRALVIGRGRPSDVIVRDRSLSREHARFELDDDAALWVEDLDSTNGTHLNGERVVGRAAIAPGDDLRLGSTAVVVAAAGQDDRDGPALVGYAQLCALLEHELRRARTFGRSGALLCFRAQRADNDHDIGLVRDFADAVRSLLRGADVIALYGPSMLLAALPEIGETEARLVARQALGAARAATLRCGLSLYPDDGTNAEALVDRAREGLYQTDETRPLVRAGGAASPRARSLESEPTIASDAVRKVYETARRVAPTALPVLIFGETGTGKELLAATIHHSSGRAGPIRSVNCGAIPATLIESTLFGHERGAFTGADKRRAGLFEEAHGGTLLLDEVGELPEAAQAALLRALESKRITRVGSSQEIDIDVRIIAATHRDLEAMCERGAFRSDLMFRLNTITLHLPPLRAQQAAIATLAQRFLEQANASNRRAVRAIDDEAMSLLLRYSWPGNVRELRNVIERAVVLCPGDVIGPDELGERIGSLRARTLVVDVDADDSEREAAGASGATNADDDVTDLQQQIERYEMELILAMLERTGWNQSEAARRLDIPRKRIQRKLRAHHIKRPGSLSDDS
ncbi:MAG: sigma 54-interacting transcriptional regulator [Myxococcales bacterium]|nr:sigma 54-interacting transcriptional regulator [Myxococcales bacterium]